MRLRTHQTWRRSRDPWFAIVLETVSCERWNALVVDYSCRERLGDALEGGSGCQTMCYLESAVERTFEGEYNCNGTGAVATSSY